MTSVHQPIPPLPHPPLSHPSLSPASLSPAAPSRLSPAPAEAVEVVLRSDAKPTVASPRPQISHLLVLPWPDIVIDNLGVDPRSDYVEQYWLGLVGPASVLLMRHLALRFEAEPEGFNLDLTHTARVLGLGTGLGRWGPVQRSLHRCVSFGFARRWGEERLLARRHLPPVTRQQLARLPEDRQTLHDHWRQAQMAPRPAE